MPKRGLLWRALSARLECALEDCAPSLTQQWPDASPHYDECTVNGNKDHGEIQPRLNSWVPGASVIVGSLELRCVPLHPLCHTSGALKQTERTRLITYSSTRRVHSHLHSKHTVSISVVAAIAAGLVGTVMVGRVQHSGI